MKFNIKTLGCKVNNYETEMMKELLLQSNFSLSEKDVDIFIINTCTVTNQANSKSMQMIRKSRKEHPKAIIVVCGCVTESSKEYLDKIDADIIIGNYDKTKIVELINEYKKHNKKIISFKDLTKENFENMSVTKYDSKTRAFVKIQDGCNNFCSYCIIPYVRGKVRSKKFTEAVEEIKNLCNSHQEIVLTGIHTGSYLDDDKDLVDLIKEISKIENLKRIRISSIEITEINDKFLHELKVNDKICNHLHIPIQNGSDEILKSMNRKYDVKYFLNKVKSIRDIRPDINLTTDLIVGFPGEKEKHFNETIETLNQIKFSKIHVFPYSLRDGTVASKMDDQINGKIKKERAKIIRCLSDKYQLEYAKKFINIELEVLIEKNDKYSIGHTDNYLEIIIKEKLELNKNYKVKIIHVKEKEIIGEAL